MSEVLVRVSNALYNDSQVLVNGNQEKFKYNGRGGYELNVQADESIEIQIERKHELLSPLWLVWGLFFFIISCFGIFDVPFSKRNALSCIVNIIPNGDGFVRINPNFKKVGDVVSIESENCTVEVTDNSPSDQIIKKRRKTLSIIKGILWAALIVTVVLVVVFKK